MNSQEIAERLLSNAYELSSYENFENSVDAVNPFQRGANVGKMMANRGMLSQPRANAIVAAAAQLARTDAAAVSQPVAVKGAAKGGAQFNIQMVRYTNNISTGLPSVIWGYYEFQSKYTEVLNLPSGVTCSVAPAPNNKDLRFTFNSVAEGTDIVDVICKEVPYLNLLTASGRGLVELSNITISVPSDTQLIQFTEKLETNRRSMFGKTEGDSIVPEAFKSPMQQQNNIISLPVTYVIDEERFMRVVMSYNAAVATTTLTLACFARFFDKKA